MLAPIRADYKLGDAVVAVGVDRIDYTKGIPDRIRAVARFLEMNPSWVGRFVFVELGAPSRVHIKRYRDLITDIEALADEVNWKFQTDAWKPITYCGTTTRRRRSTSGCGSPTSASSARSMTG